MKLIPSETWGILENLIASFIFFLPNLLLFVNFFKPYYHIFAFYNFGIIFILVSTVSHFRFSSYLINKK